MTHRVRDTQSRRIVRQVAAEARACGWLLLAFDLNCLANGRAEPTTSACHAVLERYSSTYGLSPEQYAAMFQALRLA